MTTDMRRRRACGFGEGVIVLGAAHAPLGRPRFLSHVRCVVSS